MKNNLNLILPLLRFDLGSYHIQVLQRSKDGHDKATRTICEWFVSSESRLGLLMPGIELLCTQYNARCYIGTNPKSDKAVSWKIAKSIIERLETQSYNPMSLMSHAHDSCNGNEVKYWVVDIDDMTIDLNLLRESINRCTSGYSDGNIVAEIPSKSGVHFITHPFNMSMLKLPGTLVESIDIKKNASTILCCL